MDLSWIEALGGRRLLIAAVVLILVIAALRSLFSRPAAPGHLVLKHCGCGWVGNVSRFKPVCPNCGTALPED